MKKIISLLIITLSIITLASCSPPEEMHTVSCNNETEIVLLKTMHFENGARYDLALKNKSGKKRKITGNRATLPKKNRYLNMIDIEYIDPNKQSCGIVNCQYIHPEIFSKKEFDTIVSCYKEKKGELKKVHRKINAFVYGNSKYFYEFFSCPNNFFLTTYSEGSIVLSDKGGREALTIPPNKKHLDHVGFFDGSDKLHLYLGKIISKKYLDYYGQAVKRVEFIDEKTMKKMTKEIDVLWSDLLYNNEEYGVNTKFLFQCENKKNEKLNSVFPYNK